MQVAKLQTPTQGRYLKLIALSEINGNPWTSAAEIGVQVASAGTGIQVINRDTSFHQQGIYDLNGRKLTVNDVGISSLPKGIYIYNGRKIVR